MLRCILTEVFLLLTMAVLIAVSGCSGESESNGTLSAAQITDADALMSVERLYPDLPEENFDGSEFRLMQWFRGENHIHNYFEYYTESEDGEVLNDTVYARNRTIEEKYNIIITAEGAEDPSKTCITLINAGDFRYHFCADIPQRLAVNSISGYFYELNSVPYLDISMPWRNGRAQKGFSVGGKLYIITGDYVLYEKQRVFAMFFNRDMADDYNLPDLYRTSADGNWIVELLNDYTALTSSDLNGDGNMVHSDDRFGVLSGSYTYISALLFGMGNTMSAKDEEDMPVLSLNNERLIESIDNISDIIFGKNIAWGEIVTDNWSSAHSPQFMFEEGRAMFYYEVIQVARMLDTDIAYGIIPLPKYDYGQDDYLTTIQYGNSGAISIPVNNPEIEMTGILLEALAAESTYTTLPVFIEVVLKTKKAPDERAPLMLDIIYKGIVYDIVEAFDFGKVTALLNKDLYDAKANNFMSGYAAREEAIQSALGKTIEAYQNIGK
ncbi:MAG: hypothetical protein PHZ09_09770 [Eubacteriales bacterium]|nr:hypothetical protein [Eubacteriales bacterium]